MGKDDPIQQSTARLFRNPISLIGAVLFVISTAIGLSMMLADMLSAHPNPYTGILTYLILPGIATTSIVIFILGILLERRRRRKKPDWKPMRLPHIDLNKKSHRMGLVGGFTAILLVVFLIVLTSYRAYHFSDSVEFCGLSCHGVMKPEFVAFKNSPHARVACVECHVGSGVDWYIRSKITGAYQLYSVTFDKYTRPIETPIKNLRPAQETCEQCHWPAKFFGSQQKTFNHFLPDEKNPHWQIEMLLKTGGGDPNLGEASGIHWHMNIENKVDYIATDKKRNVIPWVRITGKDGKIREYHSEENPLSPEDISKSKINRMDCMDCHNRPAHVFLPPSQAVNEMMAAGRLDVSLPYLKRESVRLLSQTYATEKEGLDAIAKGLSDFYEKEYPALFKEKSGALRKSTMALQSIFTRIKFPEMNTDWKSHSNHLGHMTSDGCFRCHDGLHKSNDGKVIPNDCNACHTILAQGSPEKVSKATLQAQPFVHPMDLGVDVTTMKCTSCHGMDIEQ